MSSNSIVLNNGQQAIINFDLNKMFIWNNRYSKANYTNNTYDDITLSAGTLMGRVSATQEIVPLNSSSSDGSQYPVGILAQDIDVAEGDTVELFMCVEGDVVENKVILHAGDTMSSVVSGRSLRDRIGADTVGIKLVSSTDHTGYDNQ